MRNLLIAIVLMLAGGAATWWLYNRTGSDIETLEFMPLSQMQVDGVAEIVQATPDGQFLVHTNTGRSSVDIVDISDAAAPRRAGRIELPGEPTSVAVSPDGRWALAVLYIAKPQSGQPPPHPQLPGGLAIIDIADPTAPRLTEIIGIGHHPDSIAVAASGADLVAIIAIENEPLIVSDGQVVDSDAPGDPGDISQPGQIQVVTLNPLRQNNYRVAALDLSRERLEEAGLDYAADAQPEFVTLTPDLSLAAVSLQENNGIVIFDPYWQKTRRMFSTQRVSNRPADLSEDGETQLTESYPADAGESQQAGKRLPDGIAFTPDGTYLLSADEGDMDMTGGRGFSIWTLDGEFVWDDGGEIEAAAAAAGFYPDDRSADKGIEIEGITAAAFGLDDFAFALSERGSFIAVYNITNPLAPTLVQLLATGKAPESVTAIPARGLIAVAAEESGGIYLYQRSSSR